MFKKNEKEEEPKKSNLRRSRSDASNLKSSNLINKGASVRKRSGSESDEIGHVKTKKNQLSPIIEVVPREDYFSTTLKDADKENTQQIDRKVQPRKRWDKPIKKLKVDEVNSSLLHIKNENNKNSNYLPEVVVIDVDKAERISKKAKKSTATSLKNKLRSLSFRKDSKPPKPELKLSKSGTKSSQNDHTKFSNETTIESNTANNNVNLTDIGIEPAPKSPRIQETIKILEQQSHQAKSADMIHSSQQPPDKLPLTRGRKVDSMVKRLNTDKSFLPPKTNIMVTPTINVQHNNNQPFSYTQPRNLSPDRSFNRPKSPSSPVIYAEVVVQNGDSDNPGLTSKQTIHTVYNGKKHMPHSDSDEGLGYEESGFSRKYDNDKSFTRFGDDKIEFYKDIDKFDEEFPITPKFKNISNYTNGYSYNDYSKTERNVYTDSSARGRGDGMDSRRRESLTEIPIENGKLNGISSNGLSDLSYRRDLLESRINSRRINDKVTVNRVSPEFQTNAYSPTIDKYVSEKTSRYYRHGSSSPVGYTEKYSAETRTDRTGEKYTKESRSRTQYEDKNHNEFIEYKGRYDDPKNLDSPASDYRSSPENMNNRKSYFVPRAESPRNFRAMHTSRYKKSEKISKERDHYKSNPEINYKYDDRNRFVSETYHSSLRRQKNDSLDHNDRYLDNDERKDKFGDSGIENDLRRDSGDRQRGNESEDEGFASSLLITSERQQTEEGRKTRREYDSDREARIFSPGKNNNHEQGDYKRSSRHEYVHRERSIDDGSHFDPRLDKDVERNGSTMKKIDKKPPKPVKKTSLEKVKLIC